MKPCIVESTRALGRLQKLAALTSGVFLVCGSVAGAATAGQRTASPWLASSPAAAKREVQPLRFDNAMAPLPASVLPRLAFNLEDGVGVREVSAAGAPNISATLVDSFPVHASGKALPGDVIRYRAIISNNGTSAALDVQYATTLGNDLTLVPNSVNVSPLVRDDAYSAVGNTLLRVGGSAGSDAEVYVAGGSVTANDSEFLSDEFTLAAVSNGATTQGGTINLNSDGSFTYLPPTGFTGTDEFTYTLRDDGIDGIANNSDDLTGTGKITFNVSNKVWYVDSSAAAGGTGRSSQPFNTLAPLTTGGSADNLDGAADIIYVRERSGDYDGNLTLENNQQLYGSGVALAVGGFTLLPASGSTTWINNGGDAITLASTNTIKGITVGNTSGSDITGSSFGTLTISDVTLGGTGRALNLTNGTLSNASFASITSTSSTSHGIYLNTVGGSLTSGSTTVSNSASENILIGSSSVNANLGNTSINDTSVDTFSGISLDTNSGPVTFGDLDITRNGGGRALYSVNNTGTITTTSGTISATGGRAIQFSAGATKTPLNMALDSISSTNSNLGPALELTAVSGNLTVPTTTIDNPTGIGVKVASSGAGALSFGTTNVTGSSGSGVVLGGASSGNAGNVAFGTLNISPDSGQLALQAQENTGIVTATSGAITTNNSTAVEITGVSAASKTPLDLKFISVNSNGGTSGIVLSNTSASGPTGGFSVSGTGTTANSGGIIQSKTGDGVALNTTQNVTLKNMTIGDSTATDAQNPDATNNIGDDGIQMTNVTSNNGTVGLLLDNIKIARINNHGINGEGGGNVGLKLLNSQVLNAGDDADDDALYFGTGFPQSDQLTGTVQISNTIIAAMMQDGFQLENAGPGVLNLTISDSTFKNNDQITFGGCNTCEGSAIRVITDGSSSPHTPTANILIENTVFNEIDTVGILAHPDPGGVMNITANNCTFNNPRGAAAIEWFSGSADSDDTETFRGAINNINVQSIEFNRTAIYLKAGAGNYDVTMTGGTVNSGHAVSGSSAATGARGIEVNMDTDDVEVANRKVKIDGVTVKNFGSDGIQAITNEIKDGSTSDIIIQNCTIGTTSEPVGRLQATAAEGIEIVTTNNLVSKVLIQNNSIYTEGGFGSGSAEGIDIQAGWTSTINATILNNTIATPAAGAAENVNLANVQFLNNGNPVPTSPTFNLDFRGNISNSGPDEDYRLNGTLGTFRYEGPGTASVTAAQVAGAQNSGTARITGTVVFNNNADVAMPSNPTAPTLPPSPLLFAQATRPTPLLPIAPHAAASAAELDAQTHGATPVINAAPSTLKSTLVNAHDGRLTQSELNVLVKEALTLWEASGLTAAQRAALRQIEWKVSDLPGWYLGEASGHTLTLDTNGGGNGWFIDATPQQNEEFAGTTSQLMATQNGAANGRVDALTAVLHEMGHVLGVSDSYLSTDRSRIMYGWLPLSERRLPQTGEARGAVPHLDGADSHFIGTPISIGSLPEGKSVTIVYSATVDNPITATSVSNQGTISGSNFSNVLTDDPDVNVTATDPTVTELYVNQAPVNTLPAGPLSATEDTQLSITGLSIADADAGSADVRMTLAVAEGTLTVKNNVTSGLVAADINGNGTGTVVLTGTLSEINTTLAAADAVVYQGKLNFNGVDTLSVTTNDLGNFGAGPAQSDSDDLTINVAAANDLSTATVSLNTSSPKTNDTLTASITGSDIDGDALSYSIEWKVDGVSKQVSTKSGSGVTNSASDSFDLSSAGFGDKSQVITVEVTPNDGTANGTLVSDTATVGNTAPVAQPQNISTTQEESVSGTLTAIDADGDTPLTFTEATGPANGTVTVDSDGSFTYTPTGDYKGNDSFTFTASDGADSGAAATVSISITTGRPVITRLSAASGKTGRVVTIDGRYFTGVSDVKFNTTSVPAADIEFLGDDKVRVKVPAGATSGPVHLTTPVGTGSSSATFIVDNSAPAVAITSPAADATVFNLSTVSGTVSEEAAGAVGSTGGSGLRQVYVRIRRTSDNKWYTSTGWSSTGDSSSVFQATVNSAAGTWSSNVSSATLPAGTYLLYAYAADQAGNTGFVTRRVFIPEADTRAPSISITSPANNNPVSSLNNITGSAHDEAGGSGLRYVYVRIRRISDFKWYSSSSGWSSTMSAGTGLPATYNSGTREWTCTAGPSSLAPGDYLVYAYGIDMVGNTSFVHHRVNVSATGSPSAGAGSNGTSSVKLSSAVLQSSGVQLKFTGALQVESATDAAVYQVLVNGTAVDVESVRYEASSRAVTLSLAAGVLQAGDEVVVSWSDLRDAQGRSFSGKTTALRVR